METEIDGLMKTFDVLSNKLLQTEIYDLMKNFAVLSYLANRDICLMKKFAVLPILQKEIFCLMKNFAVFSYLTKRDIWSE